MEALKGPQDELVQKLMAECDREVEQLKAMERLQKELAEHEAERARALRHAKESEELKHRIPKFTLES